MKNTTSKLNINQVDLFLTAFIFVFTAINFYAFLYMSRECVRYFSISYEYDIWILTSNEVKFYNRFYAAISLIMALGSTITFISNRPSYLNGSIRERTRTLNDSRVLNWVFIMWAVKLGFVFGLLFNALQSYYEFGFYPDYRYLFVLFVVVLYLQLWTNLRRQFKPLTAKLFIPLTLCFVVLIFALGSIHFIDYESLNQNVLSKNPYHKLEINKPQSKSYEYARSYSTTRQLYFGRSKGDDFQKDQLMYQGGLEISLSNIDSLVKVWKLRLPEHQYRRLRFVLNIDKSIQMKHVNELKDAIEKTKISRVGYSVVPEGVVQQSQQRFKRNIIPANIVNYTLIDSLIPDRLKDKRVIDIAAHNDGYSIEGIPKPKKDFEETIDSLINESSDYHFNLVYKDDLTFGNFIATYAIIYGSIMDNRDKYSRAKYGRKYVWNSRAIREDIGNIFPLNIEDRGHQNK